VGDRPPALTEDDVAFVRKVAGGIRKLLPPDVSLDELVSCGTLGMIEARSRFNPARGVPFHVFAHYRVRGAIYDGLRQMSWLPPNAYKRVRMRERADLYMESLAETAWGGPSRSAAVRALGEVAADLGVVYLTTETAAQAREAPPEPARQDPEAACDLGRVIEAMKSLSREERKLLRRLYVDDASLSEAGKDLGLSRSWLCRMHAKAIRKLRERLGIGPPEETAK
jgi:RNA polymerase sigma factor FliA